MRLRVLIVLIVLAASAAVMILGLAQIKLDALHEPSRLETFFATKVRNASWSLGAAATVFPHHQPISRQASKRKTQSTAPPNGILVRDAKVAKADGGC
jgi:hypothetical protein